MPNKSTSEVFSARKSRLSWKIHAYVYTYTLIERTCTFDITIYVDTNVNGVVNSSTQGCGPNQTAGNRGRFGRLQPMWFAAKLFSFHFSPIFFPFPLHLASWLYIQYTNTSEEVSHRLTRNYIAITARTVISLLILCADLQDLTCTIAIYTL